MDSLLEAVGSMKQLPGMFNAGAQLVSTILDDKDRKNQEVANAELRNQQAKMQAFEKAEMDKFANRTDFENFEKEWNEDLSRFKAQYNSSSGENAYKNNYTAEKGNEMFDQLKINGDVNLNNMINAKKTDYSRMKNFNTIETINETQPATQERIDSVNGMYDTMKAEGQINEVEYNKLVQDNLNKTQYEWTVATAKDYISDNINVSNAEYAQYVNNLSADDFTATHKGHGDAGIEMHAQPEALEAAKKTIMQDLHDKQYRFNTQVYSTNTEILTDVELARKPAGQLISEIKTQINFIESQPPVALADDDRRQRIRELTSVLDALQDNDGNSTKAAASAAWNRSLVDKEFDRMLDAGYNGTQSLIPGTDSMYAARDAFMDYVHKQYEAAGEDVEAADLDWFNKFNTAAKNKLKLDPRVEGVMKKVESICSDYTKKDKEKYWPLYSEYVEYTWDLLMETDMSKLDPQAIVDQVNQRIENVTMQELKIQSTDGWLSYKADSTKKLAQGIAELQGNDIAFTDRKGDWHVDEKAMESVNNEIIPAQVEMLSYLGVENPEIHRFSMSENKQDIDLNPSYKDADGNEYKFVSTDKNKFDIYKNGKKVSDEKQIEDAKKKATKEAREAQKAKRKKYAEEQKALSKKRTEANEETIKQRSEDTAIMVQNTIAPPGTSQKDWDYADQRTKEIYLYDLYFSDYDAYNKYKIESKAKIK